MSSKMLFENVRQVKNRLQTHEEISDFLSSYY